MQSLNRFLMTLKVFLLVACTSHKPVPVDELSQPANGDKTYKVAAGDTLFSIAWRFDKDLKQLADANDLSSPYIIHVGQILRLDRGASDKKNPIKTKRYTTNPKTSPSVLSAKKNAGKKPSTGVSRKLPNVVKANPNDSGWLWPVNGTVVKQFSMSKKKTNKGIDIKSAKAKVISSRSGKVVYAGNRLKGYGNLIIVKHSEQFLSAYAHNKSLLVKEGDWVKQGQAIASLGRLNSKFDTLHFEVRKQGKPVNPLKYLKAK